MNRTDFVGFNRSDFVNRFTDNIHDAAERCFADRNRNRSAGINDFLSANQTVGCIHRNCANCILAKVLGNFKNQPMTKIGCFQSIQNLRQMTIELNIDNSTDNLRDMPDNAFCCIKLIGTFIFTSRCRLRIRVRSCRFG